MLLVMDLLSTFCFACIGASIARRTRLNCIGVISSAFLASTGGGTVREVLLRSDSLFWIETPSYLLAVLVAVPLAAMLANAPRMSRPLHEIIDSLATSVFILVGVLAALEAGCTMLVVVLMGMLTGIGGGIIRQVVFDRQSVLQNRRNILTSAVIALFCTVLVILVVDVTISVALLAIVHFALGKSRDTESRVNRYSGRAMRSA